MTFSLDRLNQLTHNQIDTALEYLCRKYKLPFNPPLTFECSPYLRLFDLINPIGKSNDQTAFDLKVLAKLSGGDDNELGWLTKHSRLVVAARIFLKFKIQGDEYLSDYGNNNTCLHDAVLACAWRTNELTGLLIQNGANPTQKNDEDLTAAVLYMQRILPEESKAFPWVYSSPKTSLRRKMLKFVAWIMENYPKSTVNALSGLILYFPLSQHPHLLDYRPMVANDSTFLHKAVEKNSVEMMQCLLELGANPNVLMNGEIKPIHLAVANLMDLKNTHDGLRIIALLLAYELIRSIPQNTTLSSRQLVDALLKLDISKIGHRNHLARMIYTMDCLKPLTFSLKELISTLNSESNRLTRSHITIDFSSKIGEGAFANVYKGLFISQEVAIKLGKPKGEPLKIREEATLLRQLNHPNIIHFICTIDRNSFGYVMPYAAGGCLGAFLAQHSKPLSAQCLYSFSKQMNEGLRYLHDKGYVHLDLKPANVLLDNAQNPEDSRLLLADLGAAAKVGQTRTHAVTTFAFCSPEGFDFKCPYAIAHDTYSFGLCLGYMDTKNHPWIELGEDLNKHSLEMVERVRAGKRTVFQEKPMSPKVAPLVKWCWEQKPSKRPSHDDIDDYLELIFNPNTY